MSTSKEFYVFLKGLNRAAIELGKSATPIIQAIERDQQLSQSVRRTFVSPFSSIAEYLTLESEKVNHFAQALRGPLEGFEKFLDELPCATRKELETLAKNGWYVDPDMPASASTELAELFDAGNENEANADLEKYFCREARGIRDRLSMDFPDRQQIILEAFDAHERGAYALSVPVFLSQADGISVQLIGQQLYSKKGENGTTTVNKAIPENASEFTLSLLHPLTALFPICLNSNDCTDTELNRHSVFHGGSTNYNSLRNSCKAMSLLSFSSWVLADIKSDAQQASEPDAR